MDLPDVACPAIPFGPPPIPLASPSTWDPATGDVLIKGDADTFFPGGTYFFHNFNKVGSGQLKIAPGDIVDIYVSGALLIKGDGWVNPDKDPENSQIWGCGTDTSDWTIVGDNNSWLTVYAPHHHLTLWGDGNKSGSFVAGSLTKQGTGNVFFEGPIADDPGWGITHQLLSGSWLSL